MDEDRNTAYLASIKETCHRQVEEEVKRVKQHFEDEARIVKKQNDTDVQILKSRYEKRIIQCQEDLQREYEILLAKELEAQRNLLQSEYDGNIKVLTEEAKRIQTSLEKDARITKKKFHSELKKEWKLRYEALIRQSEDGLQREYNLLLAESVGTREMELSLEYEGRVQVLMEDYNKKENELQLQLSTMEQKCETTVAKRDRHWNDKVNELMKMLAMETEEKSQVDMKHRNIIHEKDTLIATLTDEKSKVMSECKSILKDFKQQELEKKALKSKVSDLRSKIRHAESSFTEKLSEYEQDRQEMTLSLKEMHKDNLRLQTELETESRRRSTIKADFKSSEERWCKEKFELIQTNEELKKILSTNDHFSNEELFQLKRELQQSRDEKDALETKLQSLNKQMGLRERDMDLITMQMQQQADSVVSLQHKYEQEILTLKTRHLDICTEADKTWSTKCDEIKKELCVLQHNIDELVREKEGAIFKAELLEKKLADFDNRFSMELSEKQHELSAAKNDLQTISSQLLKAQEDNTRLKEMIGMMRKDMDLMISLKPKDTASASETCKLEELLCNVLTTVSDKFKWSETNSIQLDKLVGDVNDIRLSVVAMNSSQR